VIIDNKNPKTLIEIGKRIMLEQDKAEKSYLDKLKTCRNSYISQYPYVNMYSAWDVNEPINIQHYNPNGGFHLWHTERTNAYTSRHMVFMTYLNDVTDAGETEFYHQKIKVKPERGLTLIWPADWTFTHRGIASPTQEKYIITGWFSYLK
jgi:hypothetical protein